MSDHAISTELTGADIERALARATARGADLIRRRQRRRASVSVVGIAVLLAGGFGILSTLAHDDPAVVSPAGTTGTKTSGPAASTTTAPPAPTTTWPSVAAWPRTEEDDVVVYTSPTSAPNVTVIDGDVGLGGGITQASEAGILDVSLRPDASVVVRFACQRSLSDHVDEIRIRHVDNVISVDGTVTGGLVGEPCTGAAGVAVVVPVPGPAPTADAVLEVVDLEG